MISKTVGIVTARSRRTDADYEHLHEVFAVQYQTGDRIACVACRADVDPFAQRLAEAYNAPLDIFRADPPTTRATRNRLFITPLTLLLALPPAFSPSGTRDLITAFRARYTMEHLIIL